MAFKLFDNVKYCEVVPYLEDTKGLDFKEANIWVDVDKKELVFDTDNRRYIVYFTDYDKLLSTITSISKELYFRDMLDSLNRARDQLTAFRRYPQLQMLENEITSLLSAIAKAVDHLFKDNFTLMLRLGDFEIKDIESYIKDHPEIRRAIEDGIERYRELCWESDDDGDDCDNIVPAIYESVHAIPEERRIVTTINVDESGEVYQFVKGYDSSYEFLKALEGYMLKAMVQ